MLAAAHQIIGWSAVWGGSAVFVCTGSFGGYGVGWIDYKIRSAK